MQGAQGKNQTKISWMEKSIENWRYLQKTNKWVESDCSGSAWVKQSDGCGDEWSAVALLRTRWVWEFAAERAE